MKPKRKEKKGGKKIQSQSKFETNSQIHELQTTKTVQSGVRGDALRIIS